MNGEMCLSSGIFRAGQEHLTEMLDRLGLLPWAGVQEHGQASAL